jgi:hypothetical protein
MQLDLVFLYHQIALKVGSENLKAQLLTIEFSSYGFVAHRKFGVGLFEHFFSICCKNMKKPQVSLRLLIV